MKKTLIAVFILFCISATGCNTYLEGHEIVGSWVHNEKTIKFGSNGKTETADGEFDYFISEQKVLIDKNGTAEIYDYTINSNGSLTLNDEIYYPTH